MLAALAFLNANKNIVGAVALVMLGVTIVTGSYVAGKRAERNKGAVEIAKVNVPLAKLSGKDGAEVQAEDASLKAKEVAAAGAVKQSFILNEETVRWINGVR